MATSFDAILPRLVAAYERGRLVPFIGSGMSLPTCPSWPDFIARLEHAAEVAAPAASGDTLSEQLIRRANVAARKLRLRDPHAFGKVVESTMGKPRSDPPQQTFALARVWWPLVLTTNYDNCYVHAFRAAHAHGTERRDARRIQVLGRSPSDCQRVLASLSSPSDAILWALQGFVPAPARVHERDADPDLSDQLVVGHQEYREVTNREPHFRRAFAEVFRSRSLFFLGSGLSEPYLLDLFGEVLEMFGPSTRPNYALISAELLTSRRIDPDFMLARFQTVVIPYGDHAEVPQMLARLAGAIEERSTREVRWSYGFDTGDVADARSAAGDLIVVRSELEAPEGRSQCLAVSGSADRSGYLHYSGEVEALLREGLGLRNISRPKSNPRSSWEWTHRFARRPVYVVGARDAKGKRDLRNVFPACTELFERAWQDGFRSIRMQIPAAGKNASFPAYHAFTQVARAFGFWRRFHPERRLTLELYAWKPAVFRELSSGRLDVVEVLACGDIRFWVDIQDARRVERRLFYEQPELRLGDLCDRLQLPRDGWTFEVEPVPSEEAGPRAISDCTQADLIQLGVVPGSTLRFRLAR